MLQAAITTGTGGVGTGVGTATGVATGVVPGAAVVTTPAVTAPVMMAMSTMLPGVALGILKALFLGVFNTQ